jgi:hypothetical protein
MHGLPGCAPDKFRAENIRTGVALADTLEAYIPESLRPAMTSDRRTTAALRAAE